MELEACVTALKMAPTINYYTQANCVVIRTDSRYVVDYYISALTHWRQNRWHNRAGKAVDNADLWKQFVKNYEKIPKPKQIEWVKGHGKGLQKDPHNYTADRLADKSARSPLRRSEYRSSVRRKRSPKETEIGSIQMRGQQLSIHVIETMWLKVQKKWKYRCEVISTDSPHFECVDWVYSLENLRDGYEYDVRLNDDQKNPTIVEMLRELQSTDDG